jgi:hypothetical protein
MDPVDPVVPVLPVAVLPVPVVPVVPVMDPVDPMVPVVPVVLPAVLRLPDAEPVMALSRQVSITRSPAFTAFKLAMALPSTGRVRLS